MRGEKLNFKSEVRLDVDSLAVSKPVLQNFSDVNLIPIRTPTELGESLKELNKDTFDKEVNK